MSSVGTVFLVGCGPGDPGLITVRALEVIEEADVIIYDRLMNSELLAKAKKDAEFIYVGKESCCHSLPQSDINSLMVKKAREGKTVARLKGGDPFVFGRGGEEALYLRDNGVPFEVVPGVTSAVAVPAYAGIAVTHRDYTSSLAIITGHERPGKEGESIDWAKLATGVGTLVILMGVENLAYIADRLLTYGRSKDTPVALIRWGTLPQQEVLVGTLENIVEKVAQTNFLPPAVIVVGEVVGLRERLAWYDAKPLFGKKIVVTRSREQASVMVKKLKNLGAQVIEFPTIEVRRLPMPQMPEVVKNMAHYRWMIFTSANGVKHFVQELFEQGYDIRDLKGPRLCAIGPGTALELTRLGLKVALMPSEYRAEAVAEALISYVQAGEKVLLARAKEAREVLPQLLVSRGIAVDEIKVYETLLGRVNKEEFDMIAGNEADYITFSSSSTVKNFIKILGEDVVLRIIKNRAETGRPKVACIGPITAETAEEYGLKPDLVAKEYTIDGLIDVIRQDTI